MAVINRVRVLWSGGLGGPGVTTFYTSTTAGLMSGVSTWFATWASAVPAGIVWSFPNTGDQIEDTTGELVGTWTGSSTSNISAIGGGDYTPLSGAQVRFFTAGIVEGRHVKGRMFFVPVLGSVYDTGGLIQATTISAETTALVAFLTAVNGMVIWSRPLRDPNPPHSILRNGSSHPVISGDVPAKVVALKSRRD